MERRPAIIFTDDKTRYRMARFMSVKSETPAIKTFADTAVEGWWLRAMRCDQSTEYINKQVGSFCRERGIMQAEWTLMSTAVG